MHSILTYLFSLVVKIANIGITKELNFQEKTKTQVLNVALVSGLPASFTFCILNYSQEKLLLSLINFLLFVGGIFILIINSRQQFLLGRLIATFLASILFVAGAVLYRNGGEYYLIANLIVIIIYFNDKKYLIFITIFNSFLFIGIKLFLNTSIVYETVAPGRIIFNMCWAMFTGLFALLFFKKEHLFYLQQIEVKNIELQRLNETKEKLFSIIAHDLRSPIGQLRNSLDLVNKEYISAEKFIDTSAKLSTEVDQLQGTLDNLLNWSLSQFNGIRVTPVRTSLAAILERKYLVLKQKLDQKNIHLQIEGVDQFIYIDPDHLRLVMRNLISNAIKFSYRNSTITIRAHEEKDNIVIEIIDQGTGMSEEEKKSLFDTEKFTTHVGTENEKGTGLGLKLCKEFIEKNNGSIWFESKAQVGTTFFVSVPKG